MSTITSSADQLDETTPADYIIELIAACRAGCLDDKNPADRVTRRRACRLRVSIAMDAMSHDEMREALKAVTNAVLLMA